MLRCKGTATCFLAILAQRDNFCDFQFASLDKLALQNRDLLLQNRGPFVNLTLTGLGPFELKSFWVVLRIIDCVINCFYDFIENLCLKGALGVCSVLPQALQGGIIRVLKTHFLSFKQKL